MRLTLVLSLLLASVVLALLPAVNGAPTGPVGMITVPIRSLHNLDRKDVHPLLSLQQHLNRAERRLARMTGRTLPSDQDLLSQLHKRMFTVVEHEKRYNRPTKMIEALRNKALKQKLALQKGKFAANTGVVNGNGVATNSNGAGITGTINGKGASINNGNGASIINGNGAGIINGNGAGITGTINGKGAGIIGTTNGKGAGIIGTTNGQGAGITGTTNGQGAGITGTANANGAGITGTAKGNGAGTAGATSGTGVNGASNGVGSGTTGKTNGNAATGTNGQNAAAGEGVSPIDIQAVEGNTLTPAGSPTGANSLGLDIEGADTGYLAKVQIGTPPRDFEILMDSGSADFWVGAENCQSEAGGGCGKHQFLGKQSSSSFVDTQQPFKVTYGTGEVSGTVVKDNLNLAGLKLNNHVFGTAQLESVEFSSDNTKFDGLMGLAQSGLSQQKTATPIEALVAQGVLKEAITSYKISRLADQKNDGEITFGGLDNTKFDSNTLVTLPNVNQQGFWEAAMDDVTVDGKSTGLVQRTAILDTGTTLIVAPAADVAAVHKLITGAKADGQGGFTIPCTTTQKVALKFGGGIFEIDPRDIRPFPVNPNNLQGDCVSGISAGNIGGPQEWLVGDVFLKNAYFSTNVGKNTVSLAKLV